MDHTNDPDWFCPGCGRPVWADAGYLRGPTDPAGPRLYVVKRRCCMRQAGGSSCDPKEAHAEAAANWRKVWGLPLHGEQGPEPTGPTLVR